MTTTKAPKGLQYGVIVLAVLVLAVAGVQTFKFFTTDDRSDPATTDPEPVILLVNGIRSNVGDGSMSCTIFDKPGLTDAEAKDAFRQAKNRVKANHEVFKPSEALQEVANIPVVVGERPVDFRCYRNRK